MQVCIPSDGWYRPATHAVQSDAPCKLNLPAEQLKMHEPSAWPNIPAAQSLHTLDPSGLCFPAAHVVHCDADAPLYLPRAHAVHASAERLDWYLPPSHTSQKVIATSGCFFPASHAAQCDSDSLAIELLPYLPASHAVHSELEARLYVPEAQLPEHAAVREPPVPNLPATHRSQSVRPATSWYSPTPHSAQ